MLNAIKVENVLFLDIETVPLYPSFEDAPEDQRKFWEHKSNLLKTGQEPDETYSRAGIYAEFGKIICISAGFLNPSDQTFRLRSFTGEEPTLLTEFADLLKKYYSGKDHTLCGHNSKEFDFPYICRRMIINDIVIPEILDIAGKKPWEINLLDTMDMWKFGDYKNYTSLDLLASLLKIPSPKQNISGKDVFSVYYQEKNIEKISRYCEMDVLTVARIFFKFKGLPGIPSEKVIYSNSPLLV